jgi:hypothetical protein
VTKRAGSSGCFESRMATRPGRLRATSTQLPFWPLRVLLCHVARDRSGWVNLGTSLVLAQVMVLAACSISLTDSSGCKAAASSRSNARV